jgi:hypothetical protein
MADRRPTWQLVLEAAQRFSQAGQETFKLAQLIEAVQRRDPRRLRGTISPIVQGMTVNAGKGPPVPCGKVLYRVSPGFYRLSDTSAPTAMPTTGRLPASAGGKRLRLLTEDELKARVRPLLQEFDECVAHYDAHSPFVRSVQLETHRKTIKRRRELASVEATLADDQSLNSLWDTLAAWGLNQRASHLLERGRRWTAQRRRSWHDHAPGSRSAAPGLGRPFRSHTLDPWPGDRRADSPLVPRLFAGPGCPHDRHRNGARFSRGSHRAGLALEVTGTETRDGAHLCRRPPTGKAGYRDHRLEGGCSID